jgi:penicillin-binding protein 1A
MMNFFTTLTGPRFLERLRVILWLIAIAWLGLYVWSTHHDLLATGWAALAAAFAFVALAYMAGPPFLWKGPERAVWRIRSVPQDERLRMKRFWRFTRKVVFVQFGKFLQPPERFVVYRFVTLFGATFVLSASLFIPYAKRLVLTSEGMPKDLSEVLAYDPVVSTRVFSADGEQICTFTFEDRVRVPIEKVPRHVIDAFVAAEDQRFFRHGGIDLIGIIRAFRSNRESGTTRQGGSTLTQQVVKQVILKDNEKSYRRKLREFIVAVELERKMAAKYGEEGGKRKILEVYLNHIFLGHGTYGIQSAAKTYFGKDVSQLTVAEAAMLAGLPQAPSRDSPYNYFDRAKSRQAYVLGRMLELVAIDRETMLAAQNERIAVIARADPLNLTAAPHFCEHVRKELTRMYGHEAIFKRGLTVYTTLDMRMQRAAEAAVRRGLVDLERRVGFNGPEGRDEAFTGPASCLSNGEPVDDDMIGTARVAALGAAGISVCFDGALFPLDPSDAQRVYEWETRAGKKLVVGDLMPARIQTRGDKRFALSAKRTDGPGHPEALQAALVAVDPNTGELKALVGGYDFSLTQFNHATQARRQTGSSVKPYIYLTALMRGDTVTETMVDAPRCYATASGQWCPRNYVGPNTKNQYMGSVSLRTALAKSLNSISVQLCAKSGVDENIRTMRALGIASPVERVLPIAIGSVDLTLYEHTYAYATIAAEGRRMPRHPGAEAPGIFFRQITDESGNVLYRPPDANAEDWPQAVPAADAYALIYLMKGVVEEGTGRRARELGRVVAGKTGTTNDFKDVWFLGFTPDLVAGVWVGRMTPDPIAKEATGGGIALPIWLAFMKAAHPATAARDFPVPADVSLLPARNGDIVPFQRGRVPADLLSPKAPDGFAEAKLFP